MKKPIVALLSSLLIASTIAVPTNEVSANTGSTDANVTFTPGAFEFTEITGALGFENQVSLDATSTNANNDLSVSLLDQSGTGDGWQVKASLSNFTSGGQNVLNGASIALNNGTAQSTYEDGTIFSGVAISGDAIELIQGGESIIATAAAAEDFRAAGMGPWTVNWNAQNIALNIPQAESFATNNTTGTITWTLTSGVPTEPVDPEAGI